MKEITVHQLKAMIDQQEDFQLIDVREPFEREISELGGELIPVGNIKNSVEKISHDKKVIFYCRSGARSGMVVRNLERDHQFSQVYNLQGGILAWADEIDSSVRKY